MYIHMNMRQKFVLHLSGVGTTTGQWCLFNVCRVEKKDKEEDMLSISMNRISTEEGIIVFSCAMLDYDYNGWTVLKIKISAPLSWRCSLPGI